MPSFVDTSLQDAYSGVLDRGQNAVQARRIASSGPTLSDFLGIQAASGGSQAIAREQFQAQQRRQMTLGFDAFGQLEQARQNRQVSLLGLMSDRDQFQQRLAYQRRQDKLNRRMSLINNIVGVVGYGAGSLIGGPLGAQIGAKLFGGGGSNAVGMTNDPGGEAGGSWF